MPIDEGAAEARRAKAWSRIVRPGDVVDLEAEDEAYWLQFSPEERVELAWEISEDLWAIVRQREIAEADE